MTSDIRGGRSPSSPASPKTDPAPIVAMNADIVHQCSACGARACVVAPVAADRIASRDLMHWYLLGQRDERARVAGADYEHRTAWAELGVQTSEARREQLLRLFQACAEDFAERMGRSYVEYRGGAVVWPDVRQARYLAVVA